MPILSRMLDLAGRDARQARRGHGVPRRLRRRRRWMWRPGGRSARLVANRAALDSSSWIWYRCIGKRNSEFMHDQNTCRSFRVFRVYVSG